MYKTISDTVYIKLNLVLVRCVFLMVVIWLKFIIYCDGIIDKLTNFISPGKKIHFSRFHVQQKITQACTLGITITIYRNLDFIIENNYLQGSMEEMA